MSHIQQLNYILFIPILVVGYVQAQPISKQEAAEMAIQYVLGISDLQQRKQALVDQDIDTTNIRTFATCGKARFYIVNMPDSGWVIISGDERILPILATSPSGTFPLDNDIPPAMLGLLNDYADEIAFVQDSCPEATINSGWLAFREGVYTISSSYNGKNSSVYHSSNLLSTSRGEVQWNQNGCVIDNGSNDYCNYVYNKFCPVCTIGSCGKSYVGCVAVAIAQIMWYWQWPYYAYIPSEISVNGTPSSVLELHLYDWKQMPPYLTTSTPLLQVDAVAGFLRDCGYAAHMKYCIEDGSSSSMSYAKNALEDYFGYEISAVRSKSTTTNWIGKIKDEIDNGRPLYYRGSGTGGHFPAIDVLQSVSRVMPDIVSSDVVDMASEVRDLIATYRDNEDLITIGAYKAGQNLKVDRAVSLNDKINGFLKQKESELEQKKGKVPLDKDFKQIFGEMATRYLQERGKEQSNRPYERETSKRLDFSYS